MHLMTFMTLKKPSRFFRAMVLASQGVFYNAFCKSSCRICTRFAALTRARSPLLHGLAEHLPPLHRPHRGRGRRHLYPVYQGDRGRSPPRMVSTSSVSMAPSPPISPPLAFPSSHPKISSRLRACDLLHSDAAVCLTPTGTTCPRRRSRRTTGDSGPTRNSSTSCTRCAATSPRTAS